MMTGNGTLKPLLGFGLVVVVVLFSAIVVSFVEVDAFAGVGHGELE